MSLRRTTLLATLATLALLAAVVTGMPAAPLGVAHAQDGSGGSGSEDGPTATIRTTSQGIPHIVADDFEGIGYGYGYAFARDNICVAADTYVTVNGERSRFFGPNKSYEFGGNGTRPNNLNSDFFYQRIIDNGTVEDIVAQGPPNGPAPEVRQTVKGYVAGYNEYLRETGVDNLSDPRCRGEEWVRPITKMDAYRRFYQLGLLASQGVAIDGVGSAQPPTPPLTGGSQGSTASADVPEPSELEELEERLPLGAIGSNAYGLGREATENGRGMLLGNPHFPWDGSERFYQAQLTIPGELNVSGASLFAVPVVLIGHTENLAWSHTVSTAFRFTPFELTLVPGSPTTYLVDGRPREMRRDRTTVEVRTAGGPIEERSRTLYRTVYGSMFTSVAGQELFPWTPAKAFAMRDANAPSMRYINHFFRTNLAQSVEEYDEIHREIQGIPWVNSIAADSSGDAYYADLSIVPHVTDEQARLCNTAIGQATFAALRLPVLDGSRSGCNWGSDEDAVQEGIFGPDNLPSLFRDDYVTNSNDSYWLSNPEEPLTDFNRIIGDEDTARSLRTRLGLRMVQERLASEDGVFTLEQLQETMFNNRQYAGELFRDELVELCEQNPMLPSSGGGGLVNVSEACPILDGWDLRDDLDSEGAVLFRRFVDRALDIEPQLLYDEQYSSADPVNTPRGLNTENPQVRMALADAVDELRELGIPLDATLRDYQYERRGDERIPIHGGPGSLGVFNAINVSFEGAEGWPDVPHGSSFVTAVQFTDGCPEARSILTYSQSTNPESPHFADQTRLFSDKRWVDMLFCEDEIMADPNLEVEELGPPSGGVPQPPGPPRCRGLRATIVGTAGEDALRGTRAADVIVARGGSDRIRGRGRADVVCGGRGRDDVRGGRGRDDVYGGRARDDLAGDRGRDTLRGGQARDRLRGGRGSDELRGGQARDEIRGGGGRDDCSGGRGRDDISGC
jgi:acyl-homoserine-lactone acylase